MITLLSAQYKQQELCEAFEVSRSGYYKYLQKSHGHRQREDQQLAAKIKNSFAQSRQTYGAPRIQMALRNQGLRVGKNRISRLMKQNNLRVIQKKKYRPCTTQSKHHLSVAKNWLAKIPTPDKPNQIWVSDITYLRTGQGWLYLAAEMDVCSRRIVGWHTQDNLETSLVAEALTQAIQKRRPGLGLVHHSDRGSQYASNEFQLLLDGDKTDKRSKITASMSRAGNCYDNAQMESFWATLKTECFYKGQPKTHKEAPLMLFDYIETFYNTKRLHSSLGFKSPVDFEKQIN